MSSPPIALRKGSSVPPERRIAIVEDDESLRLALIGLIRSIGHKASGYASAEQFLANGAAMASDCIITDIHMPGLSGIEMIERLRAEGHDMPVIVITARSDPGIEAKAMASGAACFLKKPFETEQLLGCLDYALSLDGAHGQNSL